MTDLHDHDIYTRLAAQRGATKHCTACSTDHPLEAFAFKNRAAGKLHSRCRKTQRAYTKGHYQQNATETRERVAAHKKKVRSEVGQVIDAWLAGQSCETCGSTDRLIAVTPEHGSIRQLTKTGRPAADIIPLLEHASVRCRSCQNRG